MLNEKKIRLMTELARYEENEGKEALRIGKYFRSDYVGMAMLRNFFLASLGYVVILLLIASYFLDYLLDNVHTMNLVLWGTIVIGGYLVVLTLYSVVTYTVYSLRYSRARRSLQEYEHELEQLERFYDKEEKACKQKAEDRRKHK